MRIPGFTSTGSKRPSALFGDADAVPRRMVRAEGCRVWDEAGAEYFDTVMALGAVALGYAHPAVTDAAQAAVRDGVVGSLAPVLEEEVAERLAGVIPSAEAVRFLKTGAEAVAAAVRIARVETGRERVVTCGYHGWLDWCHDGPGVPVAGRGLRTVVPFDDVAALDTALDGGAPVAAIVVEPVIERAPSAVWLSALRERTDRIGAVLVFDEIKTAFRLAAGGAAARWGVVPDVAVIGKALGNGFPIAAVCGRRAVMDAATRTWISSTLATEMVSLAAARAVLEIYAEIDVPGHLAAVGTQFVEGLARITAAHRSAITDVRGLPEMCFLRFVNNDLGGRVARAAARRRLLFKRNAYNYVSLAHTPEIVNAVLERLDDAVREVEREC